MWELKPRQAATIQHVANDRHGTAADTRGFFKWNKVVARKLEAATLRSNSLKVRP
jgi:hypothetical protein